MILDKVPLHVCNCQSSPAGSPLAVYLVACHPSVDLVDLVDLVERTVMVEQAVPGDLAAALSAPPHIPTTHHPLGLLQQNWSHRGKRSAHGFCEFFLLLT